MVTWLDTPSGSVKERVAACVRLAGRVMTHPLHLLPAGLLTILWLSSRVTRASMVSKRPLNEERGIISLYLEGMQRTRRCNIFQVKQQELYTHGQCMRGIKVSLCGAEIYNSAGVAQSMCMCRPKSLYFEVKCMRLSLF